jgi:hypothetical protein
MISRPKQKCKQFFRRFSGIYRSRTNRFQNGADSKQGSNIDFAGESEQNISKSPVLLTDFIFHVPKRGKSVKTGGVCSVFGNKTDRENMKL